MSEKPRTLPPWMVNQEKAKERLDRRRKQRRARAAFYCMNEKELVEAAVSYLFHVPCEGAVLLADRKAVGLGENASSAKMTTKPVMMEESSDCSGAQETAYVSESDLDTTEMGTLPYTKSLQLEGPEGQCPDDRGTAIALKAEKKGRTSPSAAEPDDALQLVREIFFT
ncbi:uncharacterized protein si:ch211-127m7.2 [Brachionichthys hirsutus]|uniref:uncharacterized protein si:ch211-127m7.2 n=1 Tax=Brachionichthys hirsutus TaxID=412623 RepID=UPI003604DF40